MTFSENMLEVFVRMIFSENRFPLFRIVPWKERRAAASTGAL
jgi:hypothetical protein